MLTHLGIRDFAIVDSVEIEFGAGLTVLTGETGAGKSIIVDALTLIAGGRGSADLIRGEAERAEVVATFDLAKAPRALRERLEEQSIDGAADELIVRRLLARDGRSRAWLNGQQIPVQLLRDIVGDLLDIHGQHEFQSLVRSSAQRDLLDDYGRITGLAEQVEAAHRVWLALLNRMLELETAARDRDARLELLRFQVQELVALDVKAEEPTELAAEYKRLANHQRLLEGAGKAASLLTDDEESTAHASIQRAATLLRPLAALDTALGAVLPLLDEAAIRVGEAGRDLGRYVESLELDASRMQTLERRLAAIDDLARKHRVEASALPDRAANLSNELAALERVDSDLSTLRRQQADALVAYRDLAGRLTAERSTAGRSFGKDISTRMQGLGMAGGRFVVDVSPEASGEPRASGLDTIEYRVTTNPGQPVRALAKVASGGELARLSLAVQVACAADEQRCMIFDEVDQGIGGAVAEIVGRELRSLGERAQVLCVTHLAQVAAQGHRHLRVVKLTDGRTTRTTITPLADEDRVQEVARMLGGVEVTSRAKEHAREMLSRPEPAAPAPAAPRRAPAAKKPKRAT
ncbi:MAG: DNA repair protein RecN [Steroidobacteraceae bacterium]